MIEFYPAKAGAWCTEEYSSGIARVAELAKLNHVFRTADFLLTPSTGRDFVPGEDMSRPGENQQEFFFHDDCAADSTPTSHPLESFFLEVGRAWGVPVGETVRARLRDDSLPELKGRLELSRAPYLPLDPRQLLELRLCGVEFNHRQLLAWALETPSA